MRDFKSFGDAPNTHTATAAASLRTIEVVCATEFPVIAAILSMSGPVMPKGSGSTPLG